jgi:uncharacterized RDD family membrane protein YckC
MVKKIKIIAWKPSDSQQADIAPSLLGYYAGFISRLIAFIIDLLIVSISYIAITWFITVTIDVFQLQRFWNFLFSSVAGALVSVTISIAFFISYYVFFWSIAGQTPGKALMGLRVVKMDGSKVHVFRALIRYGGYFLSAIPLFFGFFWILVDDRRQGWHDKLARTYVVYVWDARMDEKFLAEEIRLLNPLKKNPVYNYLKDRRATTKEISLPEPSDTEQPPQ